MDSQRFDALTRRLGGGSRRQMLSALAAALLGHVVRGPDADEVAAACKGYGAKCKGTSSCCAGPGLRCAKQGKRKKRRCRCKKGWKRCAGSGAGCLNAQGDDKNCGSCGAECPPEKPCCFGGTCQERCNGACCPDCFVEILSNGVPNPTHTVCCEASGGTICGPKPKKKTDDRCCYPNQECVNGKCCCDGCEGSVVCGGKCCAQAACCNDKCCSPGKVCATTPSGDTCVSANRECDGPGGCFAGEVCHGGVCCSGNRVCNDGTDNFCCAADEYCEFPDVPMATCCPINTICNSTYRGHRVRR